MSTWRVGDYEATSTVVQLAIQRMGGSAISATQVDHVTQYLAQQNWFTTAADLRVALHNPTQWNSLDIPGRLKLALEEILHEWDPPEEQVHDECPAGYTVQIPSPSILAERSTGDRHADDDGRWVCIRCSWENQYQDSFCVVCFEHYSVSVVLQAPVAPSAPDFDSIVCAMPVAEEINVHPDVYLPPYPPLNAPSLLPRPPLTIETRAVPAPLVNEMSQHFKALAFNKPPSPKSKPTRNDDDEGDCRRSPQSVTRI
ncbi:hypothetical protein H257_08993 [Aphanomyces astaci]|uniref:RanBP2-type domain-containing protein n=1 Tax=Aphanomyces astaci TaxID=112090 RepID=W4GCW1_APHAT|nr:hypothetical protein H257_08993 [Aphanomyces astaci]ETV77096.1 hypothetical protein H257_08993 [Aphanomyces astaci]|eukprot:XP_009833402.1 hypothetical protein H257_08993 [Aphanomyces astaci]